KTTTGAAEQIAVDEVLWVDKINCWDSYGFNFMEYQKSTLIMKSTICIVITLESKRVMQDQLGHGKENAVVSPCSNWMQFVKSGGWDSVCSNHRHCFDLSFTGKRLSHQPSADPKHLAKSSSDWRRLKSWKQELRRRGKSKEPKEQLGSRIKMFSFLENRSGDYICYPEKSKGSGVDSRKKNKVIPPLEAAHILSNVASEGRLEGSQAPLW
ncbi:hypothetical protein Tco_0684421, partial [Tanacetum coccineum]